MKGQASGGDAAARVGIEVDSNGVAGVEGAFPLRLDSAGATLRLLGRPCAVVSDMRITVNGAVIERPPVPNGPWQTFRLPAPAQAAEARDTPSNVQVSYRVVRGSADADIPLMTTDRPLPFTDVARHGGVVVTVTFATPRAGVRFPHLVASDGSTRRSWTGRFVGVPSFVSVRDAGARLNDACAEPLARASNGGLTWRFWLLAGTMLVWVPVYLVWARRTPEEAA